MKHLDWSRGERRDILQDFHIFLYLTVEVDLISTCTCFPRALQLHDFLSFLLLPLQSCSPVFGKTQHKKIRLNIKKF